MKKRRILCIVCVLVIALGVISGCAAKDEKKISIAGKQYTEALLCSEIMAQLIEKNTDIKVTREFNLASAVCFQSVKSGEIDMYPEYTGGMLLAYLEEEIEPGTSPEETYERAKAGFKQQFNLVVLESMGFNNTYANAIDRTFAETNNIKTNSDLAPYTKDLTYGAEHSFYDRADGYFNMCEMYGYEFYSYFKMDVSLKYQSIAKKEMDVTNVYTTDGLLSEYDIVVLEDDLNFFPAYYCCPVVRQETLDKYPEIETALAGLKDCAAESDMIYYNSLVDIDGKSIEEVAKQFIEDKGL